MKMKQEVEVEVQGAGEGVSVAEQVLLPQNYPLTPKSRDELRKDSPSAKTTYYDKFIRPFFADLQKSLVDSISLKLKIAAQRFNSGDISETEYSKVRDSIYEDVINNDWISGVDDAFQTYSLSNDAYSLMLHTAFQNPSRPLDIGNLYEYVAEESTAIENNTTPPGISLMKVFEDGLSTLKSSSNELTGTGSGVESDKEKLKHTAIKTFKQIIFVSVYPERPIPFSLEKEKDTDGDNDDDLEVDGGKVDLTCPISRQLFVKPYKNKSCKHTYDLDSLKEYLNSSRQCPECGGSLALNLVEPDTIMQTRVECFQRDKKLMDLVKHRRVDDTDKL